MTDIALRLTSAPGAPPAFDLAIENGDLARDEGLRTAVLLSLYLHRRAEVGDVSEGEDPRGSWMDQYLDNPADRLGSRRWLLARAKESADTLARMRAYDEAALAWMIEDGVARKVEIETEWTRPGLLGERITITLSDGSRWVETFYSSATGA